MAEEPVEKKKEELLRELSAVEPEAERVEVVGQELIQSARLVRDVSGALGDVILRIPAKSLSPDDWDLQIEGWRSVRRGALEILSMAPAANSFTALSMSATNTSTQAISIGVLTSGSDITAAVQRLYKTLERHPLAERARSSMQRLGLHLRGGGYRTPLQLLEDAQAALERPATQAVAPASVLIPLRESIDSAIAELVRRRPEQEPAGRLRDKLISVGRQCAHPDLDEPHFERLAANGEALHRDLSAAKQAEMSREQLNEQFHRGLLFLNALMDSIDENRLR